MKEPYKTGLPSVDKPWLKNFDKEELEMELPECSVYSYIFENNKKYPNDIGISYFGRNITYNSLFNNVECTAKALRQFGVSAGQNIMLCVSGTPEVLYLILACSKIGACADIINPLFDKQQLIDRINEAEADILFILDGMYSFIKDVLPCISLKNVVLIPAAQSLPKHIKLADYLVKKVKGFQPPKGQNFLKWEEFIKKGDRFKEKTEELYVPLRPLIIVYSSGTTGASKGIVLTNDGINATIAQYRLLNFGLGEDRRRSFLSIVPIWFSTGIIFCILVPLYYGITVILEPVFNAGTFTKDICRYQPNYVLGATSLWLAAIEDTHLQRKDLSFLVCPITGGEAVTEQEEKKINEFLNRHHCPGIMEKGWGMCELGSTITTTNGGESVYGSSGYPLPKVIVSAFDVDTDQELSYGNMGELRVCSPSRMKEYYKNKKETEAFFKIDSNGTEWACTGDIGYLDESGQVFVLGRKNDFFIAPNGARIFLFEIKNIILQDAGVKMCEVIGIDNDDEVVPVAHVVLNNPHEDFNEIINRLHNQCRKKLDQYAVPCGYKIRDKFEIKLSGKRDIESLKKEREGFVIPVDGVVMEINF